MIKRIFSLLFIVIFLCSFVSSAEFDNIKGELIIDETTSEYGKIKIKDWFGILNLIQLELKENTPVCSDNCEANLTINLYQKGTLIDDIKFMKYVYGTWIEKDLEDYTIFYLDNEKWVKYDLGKELPKGDYKVKIEGNKNPYMIYDWQIKTQGNWIDEWAVWGSIAGGDDAQVTLIYPEDNQSFTSDFQFSCEANITTTTTTLTNISLYTNESGSLTLVDTDSDLDGTFIDYLNNSVGITFDAGISDTSKYGIKFITNRETNIISITKDSSTGATKGYLLNADKSVNATADFVGDTATFSSPIKLTVGTLYYAAVDKNGASFTERHKIQNPYPIASGDVNFTTGLDGGSGGIDSTNRVWVIKEVTTSNKTVIATANFSRTLTEDNTLWTCKACDLEGDCGFATENRTVIVPFGLSGINYNSSTFETARESYFINVTSYSGEPSAVLYYNGTNYGNATNTGKGNSTQYEFSKQITIPTSVGTKNIKWVVSLGGTNLNSTLQTQTVNELQFDICNSSLSTEFINISFFNETLSTEDVNATISGTWYYWLYDSSINKTFTHSNTTENHRYSYCLNAVNKSIYVKNSLSFTNSYSQQRTYELSTILTNLTTKINLYLLPTDSGLFSPFQTINSGGDSLSDVLVVITRLIGSTTVTVFSGETDGSGYLSIFLNPDISYSTTFSKTGYPDNSFSFIPTSDLRTVTMGQDTSDIGNGTQIALNTSISILPKNQTLNNGTDYTFSFDVSSTQDINFISMNITNESGYSFHYSSNAGAGTLSQVINTGNQTRIIGFYQIRTPSETLSYTNVWFIGDNFVGDYSLYRQLGFYMEYGFRDFIRLLLVVSIIFGILIFMSSGEITEISESKIMVALLLIWSFSLIGWLNTGIVTTSSNTSIASLSEFSNQYGIAILSTAGGIFFIIRRLFITKI